MNERAIATGRLTKAKFSAFLCWGMALFGVYKRSATMKHFFTHILFFIVVTAGCSDDGFEDLDNNGDGDGDKFIIPES